MQHPDGWGVIVVVLATLYRPQKSAQENECYEQANDDEYKQYRHIKCNYNREFRAVLKGAL